MRRILALVGAAALAAALSIPASAESWYVTLNQPAPIFGSTINFTATYPQEANRQAKNTGYGPSPHVQLDCWQSSTLVYEQQSRIVDKKRSGDGFIGTSGDFILQQYGQGMPWPGGGASCTATVWYVDGPTSAPVFHIVATTSFEVGP